MKLDRIQSMQQHQSSKCITKIFKANKLSNLFSLSVLQLPTIASHTQTPNPTVSYMGQRPTVAANPM